MTQLPDSITKNDLPVSRYPTPKDVHQKRIESATTTSACSSSSTLTSASSSTSLHADIYPGSSTDTDDMSGPSSKGQGQESATDSDSYDNEGTVGTEPSSTAEDCSATVPVAGSSSSSNFTKRDKIVALSLLNNGSNSTPIPLPAPPLSMGNACGGNQSYLKETQLLKFGADRPNFGTTSTPSSSTIGPGSLSNRLPGVVGLNNLGNTCFMNSALQCLFNTPSVVEFFLKSNKIVGISPTDKALALKFQELITNVWHCPSKSIYPREFKEVLGNSFPQFKDYRQHDCQEFLAVTLDFLHEQLKLWNNAKKGENNETNSSGFASGPIDSSRSESPSNVNESDVSSSLQSPGSNEETEAHSDGSPTNKKRRMTDDAEIDSALPSTNAVNVNPPDSSKQENQEVEMENFNELESDFGTLGDAEEAKLKLEAEGFWMNHIRDNNTVIASSFQGMYKSTVTCSVCNFVSRTYEPFMYLSLPIPRTTERQYEVSFCRSANGYEIQRQFISVNIGDTVGKLKESVANQVYANLQWGTPKPTTTYVIAEVVNHQILTMLKDDQSLKSIRDGIHNVYVYELNDDFNNDYVIPDDIQVEISIGSSFQHPSSFMPTTYFEEDWENDTAVTPTVTPSQPSGGFVPSSENPADQQMDYTNLSSTATSTNDNKTDDFENSGCEELISCTVCLDDFSKSELKQHFGCPCILCEPCMTKTAEYLSPSTDDNDVKIEEKPALNPMLKCPVCSEIVDYEKSFFPLMNLSESNLKKLHLIPVLFRREIKNMIAPPTVSTKLIGHPLIVQLPSSLTAIEFKRFVRNLNPFGDQQEYKILNTSWNGDKCGYCIYSRSCNGCEFPTKGTVNINPRNSITISYSDLSSELEYTVNPPDMALFTGLHSPWAANNYKEEPIIDIHECMAAFSKIENLDDQNPWLCPKCEKNQRATKCLTVCRFPDYLIVYLKRFVFIDRVSLKLNNKLQFPIKDLDLSEYIAPECGGEHVYDLYSCVCHFGSALSGHYIAYSKHPETESWHYFSDDTVEPKSISETEFSSAYVLFYAKKGLKSDIPVSRGMLPFNGQEPQDVLDVNALNGTCDTTTSCPLPDCSFDTNVNGCYNENLNMEFGPHLESPAAVHRVVNQQESTISSTSTSFETSEGGLDNNNLLKNSKENILVSQHSDRMNSVREDVKGLSIVDTSARTYFRRKQRTRDQRLHPLRSKRISECEEDGNDEMNMKLEQQTPSPELTFENKRLTKVAQGSRVTSASNAGIAFSHHQRVKEDSF